MRLIYIKLQFSNAILLCQTINGKENVICIYIAKNKNIYIYIYKIIIFAQFLKNI